MSIRGLSTKAVLGLAVALGCANGGVPGVDAGSCTVPCGDTCCPVEETCLSGACSGAPCPDVPCSPGQVCNAFAAKCFQACSDTSQCPGPNACCSATLLGAGCNPGPEFEDGDSACLCKTTASCLQGDGGFYVCAPQPDIDGNLDGPYTCRAAGANCRLNRGDIECNFPTCCTQDTLGNQFCAPPCYSDADCGGSSHCHIDWAQVGPCGVTDAGSCGP
jgi:hypothetical protein